MQGSARAWLRPGSQTVHFGGGGQTKAWAHESVGTLTGRPPAIYVARCGSILLVTVIKSASISVCTMIGGPASLLNRPRIAASESTRSTRSKTLQSLSIEC